MTSSRFLLPAGAAIVMAVISKGVASDAARRDRPPPDAEHALTTELTAMEAPMVASSADDDTTSTDDDLDDDSTVP